jgi:hypothetical protein
MGEVSRLVGDTIGQLPELRKMCEEMALLSVLLPGKEVELTEATMA